MANYIREQLDINEISDYYSDINAALTEFYIESYKRQQLASKFTGYTHAELLEEYKSRKEELDKTTTFVLLSAIEALFRLDYSKRCSKRNKDPLTKALMPIFKKKEYRASLEDDILQTWKICSPQQKKLLSDLIGAFKYRHWIAHGRYWIPKIGKRYDFDYVYRLAIEVHSTLNFLV